MPKKSELEIALAAALEPYARSDSTKATLIFGWHFGLFLMAVCGTLLFDSLTIRVLFAALAGIQISSLFVIAHDCAHGAFFGSKTANGIVGRLAMLPALHNFTLWRLVHNRWHHATPNVRGLNSWSPMSPAEFQAAPRWRQLLERLYRNPIGFPVYYIVERWLSYKLLPGPSIPAAMRRAAWVDFVLILVFLGAWLAACFVLGAISGHRWVASVGLGFALPFMLWNFLMAKTVYLQHTSPDIPWFADAGAQGMHAGQQDVTMYVRVPRWYGFISNEIMEHTAHHLRPRVPLYSLRAAQHAVGELLGEKLLQSGPSPAVILRTLRICKLYDYDCHCWCGFDGRVASRVPMPGGASA